MTAVTASKKACLLSHALFKLGVVAFYRNCLEQAWYMVKHFESHDLAYLLAYCRLVEAGQRGKADLLYRDSIARDKGEGFRRVVQLLSI